MMSVQIIMKKHYVPYVPANFHLLLGPSLSCDLDYLRVMQWCRRYFSIFSAVAHLFHHFYI